MEVKTTAKFIKHLLILQILIAIGIGICEVIQLAEINKSPINHPEDWDYLIGYTSNTIIISTKVYYWFSIFISIGTLGRSLHSFEKRWKNIQDYNDKSSMWLLVLWCIATIPSIIILSESKGISSCSESSYTYPVAPRILRHCNAYLASLLLAYILILSIIIQLLFHLVVVKHQKKVNLKQQPTMREPKLTRVRRSKRVSKKRHSLKSAFSNSTRLSVVTEDDEDKGSNKSNKSGRNIKNNKIQIERGNKFNNEKRVYSNV